mmetsp:Transcript_10609/g.31157  ORF Transcript_10609/g.31157 Transcript_10609/m.31157 type:complete len:345 (+) Transcript_10609:51-1085(+)
MTASALCSVLSSDPAELARSLSGLPCTVGQSVCSLELACPRAALLSEVRISAVAHYVNLAGGRNEPRHAPVDIAVAPAGTCTVHRDSATCTSHWHGTSQVGDGEGFLITFAIPEPGTCLIGSCHIEVRDVTLKLRAVATTLVGQLSALFNCEALLPPGDAVLVRFAEPKAPPLQVSKFVLQLRSPVFRAAFGGKFREGASQELTFDDFPAAAVASFFEMLHSDAYTGEPLDAEDVIGLYALGDKYDVPFVQEYVINELSTRSLDAEELRIAFTAAARHQAAALRTLLVKRLRWLPEDDLCAFLDATMATHEPRLPPRRPSTWESPVPAPAAGGDRPSEGHGVPL